MNNSEYRRTRLQLLHEGGALVGTPDEHLARHEQAQIDLLRVRAENEPDRNNLDLIGG
jgi:hypothetical protein